MGGRTGSGGEGLMYQAEETDFCTVGTARCTRTVPGRNAMPRFMS